MLHNNYTQEEYRSYHVIIPANEKKGELILGDLNAATDQQLIQEHRVKTVITAAHGLEHLQIPSQLTHIVFPLMDLKTENIRSYFELSFQTIEQNLKKGAVLVHCGAGISRSATLVIAYYMKKYEAQFSTAIKFVRKIRPIICPNLGFQLQLKNYQDDLGLSTQDPKKPKQIVKKTGAQNYINQAIKSKQTLFDFTFPFQNKHHKPSRISSSKQASKMNMNPHRKSVRSGQSKKSVFQGQGLFVCGKQAVNLDLKNQSMYEPSKYSIRNNNLLMGTWGPGKHTKKSGGFKL